MLPSYEILVCSSSIWCFFCSKKTFLIVLEMPKRLEWGMSLPLALQKVIVLSSEVQFWQMLIRYWFAVRAASTAGVT